jgi:fructokinase
MTKKIIGIGNAIVDIVCKVDDAFLEKNNFIKGSMSLIEEEVAQKLFELKSEKITSGGSASNTIAALSQLGCKTAFIGKVGDDKIGKRFISEISKSGCEFITDKNHQKPSAESFILVSPDAQRTMCTYLGCASEITESDIDEKAFKDCAILYLEGYLWDMPATILALKKAINLAKKNGAKIALSTSDSFCISRHKNDFLELIKNDLDIVFANEIEAFELTSSNNFAEFFNQNKNLIGVVTRHEKGCQVFNDGKVIEVAAQKNIKSIDSTGAGDVFAAGFLYGLINNYELEKSAYFGNLFAAQIIQKFGARFDENELKLLRDL